jgi:hypothetical protein
MLIFQSRRLCCYQSLSVSSAVCVPPFGESSVYGWIYLFIYVGCWLGCFPMIQREKKKTKPMWLFLFLLPFFLRSSEKTGSPKIIPYLFRSNQSKKHPQPKNYLNQRHCPQTTENRFETLRAKEQFLSFSGSPKKLKLKKMEKWKQLETTGTTETVERMETMRKHNNFPQKAAKNSQKDHLPAPYKSKFRHFRIPNCRFGHKTRTSRTPDWRLVRKSPASIIPDLR